MTDISMSDDVTYIGGFAFLGTADTEVVIPAGVTVICEHAFSGMENLTKVVIHDGVTKIEQGAFFDDRKLSQVVMSQNVTAIPDECFQYCESLTELPITEAVATIGANAFNGCTGLTELDLGDHVIDVGANAFSGCTSVREITVEYPDLDMGTGSFGLGTSGRTVSCNATVPADRMFDDYSNNYTTFTYTVIDPEPVEERFVITYNANGGSGSIPDQVVTAGSTFSLSDGNGLSLDGYRLVGWGISSISAAPSYSLGQTFEDYSGGDKNLYAVWVRVSEPDPEPEPDPDPEPDPGPHTHRGGTATCHELAVCEVCGKTYGSLDRDNHSGGTRVVNQRPVQGSTPGYTGDTVCNGCDEVLEYGSTIEPNLPFPGESFVSGDFTFTIVSNNPLEVEVRMYNGDSRSVNVPSTASDGSLTYAVVAVGDGAFRGNTTMTSISLPSSVTSVDSYAFSDCTALESVSLPVLDKLGYSAFEGCTSLTDVRFASGFHTLEQSMFRECTALTRIDLPSSLRTIGWGAFYECSALESVDVPDGVTKVDAYSFYGCTSLAAVSIPDSVTTVGDQAFAASGLTEVTVPGCRSMGDGVFESCRSLGSVTIADDVAMIPEGIFSGCSSLDEIVFGEDPSLRTIEAQAFAGTAFTAFTIPEGVTTVDATAFSGCTALQTVGIPSTLRDMGERPFEGCSSLTSFTVSADSSVYASVDGVLYSKDLGTLVRYPSAAASAEFSVPEGTETISAGAFEHAGSLTTVEIPQSVTTIGAEAFLGCSGLRSVAIASQELTVGDGAFDLSAGGDPVSVEIFTDAPEFPQSAFGEGTTVTYDEYKNYGLPDSDEIMGDALIWIVAAIVLGVIFLAVHIVVKRS